MNRTSSNRDHYGESSKKPFRRLYRDRVNGKFLGVCTGIGNYFGIDPVIVRIIWIIFTIFWSYIMIPSYFIVYLILDDAPEEEDIDDAEISSRYRRRNRRRHTRSSSSEHGGSGDDYDNFSSIRHRVSLVKQDFSKMEKKVGCMESYITSQRYNLDKEFQNLGS